MYKYLDCFQVYGHYIEQSRNQCHGFTSKCQVALWCLYVKIENIQGKKKGLWQHLRVNHEDSYKRIKSYAQAILRQMPHVWQ